MLVPLHRALNLTRRLRWQLNKDKTAFQRIFVQDVRKCEDMLRIIRFLKAMHVKVNICCEAARMSRAGASTGVNGCNHLGMPLDTCC
jgi:hypothetical protein